MKLDKMLPQINKSHKYLCLNNNKLFKNLFNNNKLNNNKNKSLNFLMLKDLL